MKQMIARCLLAFVFTFGLALPRAEAATDTLVSVGSTWKYLDDGTDQGNAWIAPSFNDTAWPSGPAQFGYGDGDEATLLNFGPDPGNKRVTYYFRQAFSVVNPGAYAIMTLRVKRDDGVIVYLNGQEVFRDGLFDPVNFTTLAVNAADDGAGFLVANVPPSFLVAGQNVIAAEIHQSSPGSSDISFDLELIASTENNRPSVTLLSPSEGAFYTEPATITFSASASDSDGSVARVEFFQGITKVGEDTSAPFAFDWPSVPLGNYALRAIAFDNLGARGTSAVVNVSVGISTPPTVANKVPTPGNVSSLSTITVTFSEPVSGVTASDLLVNGIPALSVTGSGTTYQFAIAQPAEGTVYVGWNGTHGIRDFENPPKPFDAFGAGATWQYTLTDTVAPTVTALAPVAGATVSELDKIEITFSEPVAGVDAADLRINGIAATSLSGFGAGPYEFQFAQPANGAVNVTWAAGHGIRDQSAARNVFAGPGWSYSLNTNAIFEGQIVINEIMYHPTSEQVADEWVELRNRSGSSVNLTGWRLNRAVEFVLPNVNIPAGGYLVVAANVAAFNSRYPGVANVVGGWTGRLSNSRDEVELEDASGTQVDLVVYADQGDWAVRTATGVGWDWVTPADGAGRSMELRQVTLPNDSGQNWRASTTAGGTPGQVNSVATANLPPMILEVNHLPAVPRSTNNVTILARIVDEATSGLTVRLWRRDVTSAVGSFVDAPMLDNGLSNDGSAGDGVYGIVLSPMANGTIMEFYVQALDAGANARTWPAAADVGGGTLAQEANALFQVDDENYSSRQAIYRIIMRPGDRSDFFNQFDRVQRNATFITIDGSDVQVRHGCTTRRRGQSSFGSTPPTMKFDIPRDRPWQGTSSLNLNSVNTYAQVLGSALSLKAGLPTAYAGAVQVRFNGVNHSPPGAGMFGSYAAVEVVDGDWARVHYPEDPNGNVYSKRRPEMFLEYLGTDPQTYMNYGFDKESNVSENDWSDIINLMFALDPETTPAADYVQAVRRNANVDLWLRYFAVLCLMDYNETALSNGADDDYDLYRGLIDQRMIVLPHDFDSIFGSSGSGPNDLFLPANIPNLSRFLHHPEFEPLYFEEYRHQLSGAFATNNLFPLMDQVLGDWVSPGTIQSMKSSAQARINYVLSALPAAPVVVRATVSGEPDSPTYLNAATLIVGGTDITHYRFRLNNGAWSADRLVSQPISLTSLANGHYTVYVVGRNSAGIWQADADATVSKTWAVLSGLRGVVINEVLARNDGAVNHEGTFPDYIELFNAGAATIDLSGFRLTDDLDDPNRFTFPGGTTLAAGTYLVVYANNPDGTSGLHIGFGLDQDGDNVYLLDRATNGVRMIDSVQFGWQISNLTVGRQAGGQWGLCTPTHGAANTPSSTGSTATLKINEWLASPAAPFVDDFVEVYNPDSLPVNLGGLFMTDSPIGDPFRHAIVPLTFVPGFGYRAFIADGNRSAGADHLDFALDQERGEIALVNADGRIIDCVVYGAQFTGISQGRSPNGSSRILYLDIATPGAGNPFQGTVQPQLVNLVPLNGTYQWKYNDTGADLGTAWSATGYNDLTWPTGVAAFGFDGNLVPPEPIRTQLVVTNNRITYYFRTHFTVPAGLNVSGLQATYMIDDGAVFYVNGTEAARFNMPDAPTTINSTTLAPLSHEANTLETINLNIAGLVTGDNVLAVEVHQNTPNSADIVFGMRLDAVVVTNNPATAGVKINEILANARNSTNSDGTISDWVEFHNPSNASVDLSGMSLTDQLANPRRWVFPAGSVIAASGYRVVRFNPDVPATTNAATVLNSGFGMKASGDSLYLFNRPQSGGELLDSISFGIQAADWSIGRVPNSSSNWVLNVPSAGGQNLAAALGNVGLLKINEWMAAPASGADWFEIYNPSVQPVNLSGLYLTDDLNNRLQYPPLPPRSFISAGLAGFLKIIADGDLAAGADHVPFALGRTGESLGISDANGTLIDQYTFGAQLTGVSQGRLPDGTTNVVSFPETASPEESNFLPIPNIVINEVLSHADPPFEDAIEIRNTGGVSVNVTGWYLSDDRTALRKYRIPSGSVPANGYRVFYQYQFNPLPGDPTSFALTSARGDEVYLSAVDAQGVLTGYRAKVEFGPSANGVSFGRYVTSALNGSKVEFVSMAQRTFGVDNPLDVGDFRTGTGLANSGPKVGPVVISEIMYHPIDLAGGVDNVNEEYIELQNITASAVPLFDPSFPTNHWKLRDAVSFDFPANTTIPPNGLVLIVAFNPSDTTLLNAFKTRYNVQAGAVILGPYTGKLDNSSDSVELVQPDPPQTSGRDAGLVPYILVDKVKYLDVAPWPLSADGSGQSLTRLTAASFGNDPVNWTGAAPTPGPAAASQDTDGDGMPNSWETQYGLNPNVNDAAGDLDGDGARNLDEYQAGTAPNDPSSVLRLTVVSQAPVVMRFNAAANVEYTVQYKTSLSTTTWSTLQTVPAGNARQVQVNDPSPGALRFYRVRTP